MQLVSLYQSVSNIQNSLLDAPLLITTNLLQAIAFSFAASYLASFLLSLLHFQYADFVAENKITRILAIGVYCYYRLWNENSWIMYLASIFGMVFVSIYVYDCCWNISQGIQGYQITNREMLILVSYSLMLGSTLVLYWFILKNEEKPLQYEMLGIYILIIVLILVGNLIRQRTVINTLLAVLFMNYLIASRHYTQMIGYNLPFYTVPLFLMGLDAQKKQRKQIGGDGHLRIFKICLALACFGVLRNPNFPIEMILGAIFIFGVIINR